MLGGGSGCGGCGGIGGWIGISVVLGSMLWSSVMYSSFSVHGGDGCHKDFHSLDCIEDTKIIVLQYLMLVLLISLVLYKFF